MSENSIGNPNADPDTDVFAALRKALDIRENAGASRVWVHHAMYLLAEIVRDAQGVVAYWDFLDAVPSEDPRPTEDFTAEMDKRINALRARLEDRK